MPELKGSHSHWILRTYGLTSPRNIAFQESTAADTFRDSDMFTKSYYAILWNRENLVTYPALRFVSKFALAQTGTYESAKLSLVFNNISLHSGFRIFSRRRSNQTCSRLPFMLLLLSLTLSVYVMERSSLGIQAALAPSFVVPDVDNITGFFIRKLAPAQFLFG
jgi:hypothetical protein